MQVKYFGIPLMFILSLLSQYACTTEAFPEEAFRFSKDQEFIISKLPEGDTLVFVNPQKEENHFLISPKKEEKYNAQSWFINRRPERTVCGHYQPLSFISASGIATPLKEPPSILYCVTVFPDKKEREISFYWGKRFAYSSSHLPQPLDTVLLNGKTFQEVYKLQEDSPQQPSRPEEVTAVYFSKTQGFIGYEEKKGRIWLKKN